MAQKAVNKAREELAQMFLASLEKEKLPWQKAWVETNIAGYGKHKNPVTGSRYRGVNAVILWATAVDNGYSDPRWCTFKQASEKGWTIKKGEKGTHVEYWSYYDTATKQKLSYFDVSAILTSNPDRQHDIKCISRIYSVFNAAQIEGIPALETQSLPSPEYRNRLLEQFAAKYLETEHITFREGGDSAFYRPSDDSLTMPPKRAFFGELEYYDVFFHESAHSTGHDSRLARGLCKPDQELDERAKEELRAEIAGAFILSAAECEMSPKIRDGNIAYIQSWASDIKDAPKVLFDAIKDAGTICDFVCERGELERFKEGVEQTTPTNHIPEPEFDDMEL